MKRVNEGTSRRHLQLPSPAMIVALVALFVALTGGAFAAANGFRHGPKGIVNADDIAYNTITWREIKQRTLQTSNFSAGTIKALHGLKGAAGIPGGRGPTGPAGVNGVNGQNGTNAFSTLTYKTGVGSTTPTARLIGADAVCPSGMRATGGGVALANNTDENVVSAYPSTDTGGNFTSYTAYVYNSGSVAHDFTVVAVCVPASQATALHALPLNAAAR